MRQCDLGLLVLVSAWLAVPGAFQRPALMSAAPLAQVRDLSGVEHPLASFAGTRGLVLFFWATWSERSLQELAHLARRDREARERGVNTLAVNVDGQTLSNEDLDRVRTVIAASKLTVPVVVDANLKLFHAYGVVTVPSTALIDADLKLVYFAAGYAPAQQQALHERIEQLAGVTRPSMVTESPDVNAAARRWIQLGRAQVAGGRSAAARDSFAKAQIADPGSVLPVLERLALALDEGALEEAAGLADEAERLRPSLPALAPERARLQYLKGEREPAKLALVAHLRSKTPSVLGFAYLGFLFAQQGARGEADKAWNGAMALGGPDAREGLAVASTGFDVAAAMTNYRRTMLRVRTARRQ